MSIQIPLYPTFCLFFIFDFVVNRKKQTADQTMEPRQGVSRRDELEGSLYYIVHNGEYDCELCLLKKIAKSVYLKKIP